MNHNNKMSSNAKFKVFNWSRDKKDKQVRQLACDFVNEIGRENLITMTGGDNFYWKNNSDYGSVVVWYWGEENE